MNQNLFRAELAKKGYTQQRLAKEISMANSTMTRKIKNGSFTVCEADRIIDILGITNPEKIFFGPLDT